MKSYSVLIVEQNQNDAVFLTQFLETLPFFSKPTVTTKAMRAINYLSLTTYDFVFWNPVLEDSQGFDLLSTFTSLPPIIAMSSNKEYAYEAFELGLADYLLKPISRVRLPKAINRQKKYSILESSVANGEMIFLKVGRLMQRFLYKDIICIEALAAYSKVITPKGVFVVNDNITELSAKLPNSQFLRVHKSYIINLSYMQSFDTKKICLIDKEVPLGNAYRPSFEKYLQLLES